MPRPLLRQPAPQPFGRLSLAVVVVILMAAPGVFLLLYQQKFGFHPVIIAFSVLAVLLGTSFLALLTLLIGMARPPSQSSWCVSFLAVGLAVLISAVIIIYAGAYISNAVWGDTLNYRIVLTFLSQFDAALEFLPLSPRMKRFVLAALVASIALLVATAFYVSLRLSARLVPGVASWLGHKPAATRRNSLRLAGALGGLSILVAGTCTGLAWRNPSRLQGEPISSFLLLSSISNTLQLDNVRLAAALEDRNSLANYPKSPAFEKKNVILILSDALRADRMGVYGYARQTTPFLSSLFAKGLLHRVEMSLSTCSESFCGIASTLASRPYHQISVHNFKLHTLLRNLGYRVNFYLSGDHRGWSYLHEFYGGDIDEFNDFRTLQAKDINDDQNILQALEKLAPYDGRPSFLYFFLMSSHVSGKRYPEFDRFQPVFADGMRILTFWNELAGTERVDGRVGPTSRLGKSDLDAISNRYDNGVLQADGFMERIFHALNEKGHLKNSIVVILGDHGDGLGEHGHIGHTRFLYQEDIRIPLLIYDEDRGRYRNNSFATQLDVAPTILDRLGLPVPPTWQGVSLQQSARDRMTLHQTRRGKRPCFALVDYSRSSLMKYIRCGTDRTSEQLFDLVGDPGERHDLIGKAKPSRVTRYRREIDRRFSIVVNRCKSMECVD